MSISVLTCSATDILQGNIYDASNDYSFEYDLTIPEYQRPYRWYDQQLTQLLNDIKDHKERTPNLPYYLGSLILHQSDDKLLNIIDGQQRITTLAIISHILDSQKKVNLNFESPISQQQIKHNIKWLQKNEKELLNVFNLQNIFFTIVITLSEDDAYLFFETQNTGGVRLDGEDIIKAHHLRAVKNSYQAQYAKNWEALGKLKNVINLLLKGRYWQKLKFRELPSHREKKKERDEIVSELAQKTGFGDDYAYGKICIKKNVSGEIFLYSAQQGYEVRQPINAGINTIHYLSYFQGIYNRYCLGNNISHLKEYQDFIVWVKTLEGCGYLHDLYEACLLLYISQFGENKIEHAAKKLFRVVYSKRVSNAKAVRELSISAFVRDDCPILDWIAMSYTPEQFFNLLDGFTLTVDSNNLGKNTTKQRFVDAVVKKFQLKSGSSFAEEFTTVIRSLK